MIWNALVLALREIRRNLLRSFLTTLGIVIGVASVIAMVMLGEATTAYVHNTITKLGSNMLIVIPGQQQRGHPGADSTSKRFTHADVMAMKQELSESRGAAPVASMTLRAVYGNRNYVCNVEGSDNDYFTVREWDIVSGRPFSEPELRGGKPVCLVGETVRRELFADQDPLGASIRLENFSCTVIGLLESKGSSMFGRDQDDLILVPIRMFQRRISGNHEISRIMIASDSPEGIEALKESAASLLRERRKIAEGRENDFNIRDRREMLDTLTSTTQMLTLLLGAVAAISLVVGGIGIMNIMLVSVTERTREIGIRLAIGAMEREVMIQFLVEAAVLSMLGGVIGVAVGIGGGIIISSLFDLPLIFNLPIVIIAFAFSAAIGMIFGFFPALKAARLNPIDALRYE